MRAPPVVVTVIALLPAPVVGQHAPQLADRACDLCHATHEAAAGPFNLKAEPLQVWGPEGGDLGIASRSCMRCHAQAGMRARQPELSAVALAGTAQGGYLGYELGDDHPVGTMVLDVVGPGGPVTVRGAPDLRRAVPGRRLTPGGRREVEQQGIECSRCHDPHDPRGPLPSLEREGALCATCHDMASGGLQQHVGLACSACHRLHGGESGTLLRVQGGDVACASCHDRGAVPPASVRSRATVQLAAGHQPGDPRARSGRCTDCHTVHR